MEEFKNTPPSLISRNKHGLLENVNYIFGDKGMIDWRAMINKDYLVPNKQVFEKKQKSVPETIDGLDDRELLILLGGIKELAQTRGFTKVTYKLVAPSSDYVSAVCEISWIPNYETEGREITFSAMGDAHEGNTSGFGKNFLAAIAENRAFVRAVRNFLKINIVSQEEVGGNINDDSSSNSDSSIKLLEDCMKQYNVSFELIKKRMIEDKVDGAENFKNISDIPRFARFELIERIKRKAAEKAAQALNPTPEN